jgi:tetratricopeptide (TPR) repeat protein
MAWRLVKRNKLASTFTALLAVVVAWGLMANWLAQKQIDQANAATQEKQKELIDRTRNAVPALVVAARQVANANNFKDAHKQVDLALAYEPKHANARLLKGQIYLGQKEWTAAKAELEQYLEQQEDAAARKLLNLCSTAKVDDAPTEYAVAMLLNKQNMPGPAIPLLMEVKAEKEQRQPVLEIYRKQIEANWPGLGERLTLQDDAQFYLDFISCSRVTTLEPLQGMQLGRLNLGVANQVRRDLTPLRGMKLTWIQFHPRNVADGMNIIRQMDTLKTIRIDSVGDMPAEAFWKRYDAGEFK